MSALTKTETPALSKTRLAELETRVRDGLKSFVEVGNALIELREGKAYKTRGFKTFEDYCEKQFGFTDRHGRRMIAAAETAKAVEAAGLPDLQLPGDFVQRILTALDNERRYQDVAHGTIQAHPHTVREWLAIVEIELEEAKRAWAESQGDDACLAEMLQVAATCFACFEQHGVVAGHLPPETSGAHVNREAFMRP